MARKINVWLLCFSVFFFSLVVLHTWRKSVLVNFLKVRQPKPSGPRRILDEETVLLKSDKKLNILAWNSYWRWPDFGMGEGNQGFKAHNCSYTNCFMRVDVKLNIIFLFIPKYL